MTKVKKNPFVGLRPFESDDSYYYFGRDIQIKALLQRLNSTRFLAVVGSSGSGKSSLVRAGLIPNLEAGFLVQDRDEWQITTMKPGTTPLYNLASALLEIMDNDKTSVEEFSIEIEHSGVQAILARLKSSVDSDQTNWFLLIDQFEEIFRYGFNNDKGKMHQSAEDFVAIMLRLASQTEVPVYVCMTMRSDFLGDCDHFYQLPEAMNRSQYLVPRLTREQRREAIAGPIRLARDTISPRLLDHLLNESVDTRDDLPILQHALMRTWDDWNQKAEGAIDVEHYQNVKTVEQALSVHADEALNDLDANQQKLAKGLFQCLTEVDAGNRRIRRPCHLSEVEHITGSSSAEIMLVINQFRIGNRNFLVLSSDQASDDPLIDISHESLIRQWKTLTEWVDEEAESAKIYLRLAETAELYFKNSAGPFRDVSLQRALEWQQKKKPNVVWAKRYHKGFLKAEKFLLVSTKIEEREKESKYKQQLKTLRLTRYFTVMILIFLVVTGYFAWYAFDLKYEAELKSEQLKQQNLKANFHLAKIFEEKTERELEIAKTGQDKVGSIRRAWLYATAALSQNIAEGKYALSSASISTLFKPETMQDLFSFQSWFSPHVRLKSNVNSVAYSPDGKTVVTGSDDKIVRLWEVSSGRELKQLTGHTSSVRSVAYSPDGKAVVTGSDDKTVRLWEVSSGRELKQLAGHTSSVYSVAYSPDGKTVVTGSRDNTVRIWAVSSGQEIKQLTGHTSSVYSVAYSPDGKTVVTGSWDNTVRIWAVSSGQEIKQLTGHTGTFISVAYSPDGKTVGTGSSDKTVRIWDVSSGQEIKQLTGHTGSVNSVAYSPDGKTVVTGSRDNTVRIWAVSSGQEIKQLTGHTNSVRSVAYSPDGNTVVTGAWDKTVRIWAVSSGQEMKELTGHTNSVGSVAYSPDGKMVVTGSRDKTVRIWDVSSGQEIKQLTGHTSAVSSVAYSPDGKMVVTGSRDKSVRIWEVSSGQEIKQLTGHTNIVFSVAYSPDGKTVVTGSGDRTARIWEVSSGQEMKLLTGHTDYVNSVAYSPDGKTVVTGSGDKSVRIWDVSSGQEIKQLTGHTRTIYSVAYTPDSKMVVTGSGDKSVRIWDVSSGQEIKQLTGHTGTIYSVAYSLDGKTVVTGSEDRTVRIWEVSSGREMKQLTGHTSSVHSVAYSPDGKTVVTGSRDKTVRLWDLRVFNLFIQNNKATDVLIKFSKACEFLWQLKLDGLEVKTNPWKPAIKPQDGYNFSYDKKFRPLLNPPRPDQTKFDQVLEWAVEQANITAETIE